MNKDQKEWLILDTENFIPRIDFPPTRLVLTNTFIPTNMFIKFSKIFHPTRLFQPPRLLNLPKFSHLHVYSIQLGYSRV